MFEKCIKCEHLGKDCIPNVCSLPLEDVNKWAIRLKAYKRITNAELSERSGVPKGTIDMHFSKKKDHYSDVNYSTFAPVFSALIGSQDMKCPKDKLDWNAESVDHAISENQRKIDYLKRIAEWRLKAIVVLSFALGITLVTIIVALLIDKFDPDLGFIWRNIQN
jgi:hypothetical protein